MDPRDLKHRGLKSGQSNLSSVEQFKTQISADTTNATRILQMIEHTFYLSKRRPLTETVANALFSKVLDAFQQNKLDDDSSVKVLHEFLEFSLNECEYHLSLRTKALRIINEFLKKKGVLTNFVVKENEDEIKLFGDHLSVFGDYEAQTIILQILLKISHGKNRLYWSEVWFESEELKSRFIKCDIYDEKDSRSFLNKYNKSLHQNVRRVWSLLASSVTVESSDREMKSEVTWKWINFNKGTESISFTVPEQEQNVECKMLQIKTSDIDRCILTVSPGNAQLRVTLRRTTSELLQSFNLFFFQLDIRINLVFTFHYVYTTSLIHICDKCQVPLNYDDSVFDYIGKSRRDFHVPVKASVTKSSISICDVESFMQTAESPDDNLLPVNEIPNIANIKKSEIPLLGVNQTIPEKRETVSSGMNEELVAELCVSTEVRSEEKLPSGPEERILKSKARVLIGKPQYGVILELNGESAGKIEFDVEEPVQAALRNKVKSQSIVREELVQLDVDDVVDEFEKIDNTHATSTSTGKRDSGISSRNSLSFLETSHNTLSENVDPKSRTRLTRSFLPSVKQSQQMMPNKPKHIRHFARKPLCNDFMCSEFFTKFNTKLRRQERPLPILFEDIQSSNNSSNDVEQPHHHHRSLSRRRMPIVGALSMRMRKLRKSQIISTDMDTGSAGSECSWFNGRKKRKCSLFETPHRNYSRCNRIHHKKRKSPTKLLSSSSEQDKEKRFSGHKSPRKRKATAKLVLDLTSESDNDIGDTQDKGKWNSIDDYEFVVEKSGSKSNGLSCQAREDSVASVFSSIRSEPEVHPLSVINQKFEELTDKIHRCVMPEHMEDLSDSLTLPVTEHLEDVETDSTVPKKMDKSTCTQLGSSEDYEVFDNLVDYYSEKFLPIAHSTLLDGEAGKLGVCKSPKAYHSDCGISSFEHRHKISKMSDADHLIEMPSAINSSMLSNSVIQDVIVNAVNDVTRLSRKYAETVNHYSQKVCTVLSASRQRISDFLKELECEMICYSKPTGNLATYLRDCRKQRLRTSEKMNSLEEMLARFFSDDSLDKKLSLVQATASEKYYKEVNNVLKEASKMLEDATLKEMKCYLRNVNRESFPCW